MNYKGILSENIRVLEKILGPNIELVTGDKSKWQSDDMRPFCSWIYVIGVIKSGEKKWRGINGVEEYAGVGNLRWSCLLEDLGQDGRITLGKSLAEMGWEAINCVYLAEKRDEWEKSCDQQHELRTIQEIS